MKRIFLLILILLFIGGVFLLYTTNEFSITQESAEEILKAQPSVEDISLDASLLAEDSEKEILENEYEKENHSLPDKFKLDVPFSPQAPFALWDEDHNEACEEAAVLIVHYFWQKKELTPEIADKEILAMIDYQKKNWGGHYDLETEQVAELAEEFYNYNNTEVKYDISIKDIKKEIFAGNPVILPTAGRLLKNPYYRQPGPIYHMLVAIGYDDEKGEMIVNDPGTQRGEDFVYKYDILEKAIHNWNQGEVENGKRAMIILKP